MAQKLESYAADAEMEEEVEDEEDDDYNDSDADAEEKQAAAEDEEDAGASGKRKKKRRRSADHEDAGPKKRKRMELDAVDEDELQALREDAIEQFGADVLADEEDSTQVHTRGAERAIVDSIMASLMEEEQSRFRRRDGSSSNTDPGLVSRSLHHISVSRAVHGPATSTPSLPPATAVATEAQVRGFLADLGKGKYGQGNGWHASLGGVKHSTVTPGPMLLAMAGKRELDIDALASLPPVAGAGTAGVGTGAGPREEGKHAPQHVLDDQARERALAIASNALALAGGKKVAVTSSVKFAGETMTVTKLVTAGSSEAKAAEAQAAAMAARRQVASAVAGMEGGASVPSSATGAGAGSAPAPASTRPLGLDAVVSNLDKPEGISTLVKTSLDWDQYKAKSGLDEAFDAKARAAGFVEKQAFLGRVDARAEEQAKARRAEERRARDMAPSAAR